MWKILPLISSSRVITLISSSADKSMHQMINVYIYVDMRDLLIISSDYPCIWESTVTVH